MTDQEIHKLGEVLRSAREARGVDLARVERDTKIRARYLSALERGLYRDLPGAVYTKGFLRNYGSYLGLDSDYLVDLYRLESAAALSDRPSAPTPPRPIAGRRSRAFVVTPGALLAALLTVGVVIFVIYVVGEFVTFAGTPDLRITDPAGDVSGYDGDAYTFRGVTEPNSRVTAETRVRKIETTADDEGTFEISFPLVPGSNVITIVANDPLTGRDSEEHSRTILVGDGSSPVATPGEVLALSAPEAGAAFDGPVIVSGTAPPGADIVLNARPTGAAPPSFRVVTLAGQTINVPRTRPSAPEPITLTAGDDGAFDRELALAPGSWRISVALVGDDGDPITRAVTVRVPDGLSGILRVAGSPSYLEIDQDLEPMPNVSGRNASPGTRVRLEADERLRIRVGNGAAVRLVINGIALGAMGDPGAVVEWQITRL